LLPGSVQLLRLEDKLHQSRYAQFFKFLYKGLKPYHSSYDYIFLDCAPNLYSITKAALFAADYCAVPYVPDYLSLSGFGILSEQVEEFYDRVSGSLTGRIRPRIAALIVSHFRQVGNVFAHAVNELELQILQLRERGLSGLLKAHAK
jgi:chromosome partitioning protein